MGLRYSAVFLAIFAILAATLAACAGGDDASQAPSGDGTASPSPSDQAPGNGVTPPPPDGDDAAPPAQSRQILFFETEW